MNNNTANNNLLLQEILPLPAEKIVVDRFSATTESKEAPCSGNCMTGTCNTLA